VAVPSNERLYVALDVKTATEASLLTGRLASLGVGFKIGPHFNLDENYSNYINALCSLNNHRFFDLKHLDIPETVSTSTAKAASRRFNLITVHSQNAIDGTKGSNRDENLVRAAVAAAKDSILNVLLVTRLSSLPPDHDAVMRRVEEALVWGCQGVVCPAPEIAAVRRRVPEHFLIVTAGIRPPGYSTDDHDQYGSPRQAIGDGADFLVVGRPIIRADDPVGMACRIIEQIR
jgi:orotidine-5'-phosphate decarboxylase